MGASKTTLTVPLCARGTITTKSNSVFVMWQMPYWWGENTLEIVHWTLSAGQFRVQTRDALRGCILAVDAWDGKCFLHSLVRSMIDQWHEGGGEVVWHNCMPTRLLSHTAQCVVVETGHSTIMERQYYLGGGMATNTNGAIRRGGFNYK